VGNDSLDVFQARGDRPYNLSLHTIGDERRVNVVHHAPYIASEFLQITSQWPGTWALLGYLALTLD
jgi:hypothetical protein